MRLVNDLSHPVGVLTRRHSGQVTTPPVIALGRGLTALALLRLGQLLEAAVKLLHLPAHLHGLNHYFAGQMSSQIADNDSFNVAVCGHQLEELYPKGHSFQAHVHAPAPALGRRFERIQPLVAAFFGPAHQPVAL